MQPLQILEYITASSLGGAEHVVRAVGHELEARGHSLLFVSPRDRLLTPILRKEGFAVLAPRTYGKVDPLTLMRLAHIIRSRRIQVIHTHLSTASLLGSLAARVCGIPCVATAHGLNTAFSYRYATRIVAVSDAVRQHFIQQGIPAAKIRVVHNGINVDHFGMLPDRQQARDRFGFGPEDQVVLYAGHLTVDKGAGLLLPIMQRLWERHPSARLLLLGEGELRSTLEKDIREGSLEKRVLLMGFQADIRPFLAAADLMLLPSLKEGLGMVLLEAMAAGLPAVATDVGGIPEAIDPGLTGELVPLGDVDAFALTCTAILTDRSRYERMSAAARIRAREQFSIQRSVSALEGVFEETTGTQNCSVNEKSSRSCQ
ncbi:MAG: glycosyltransferase [Armatimonadota bacterium]|nr:glycosyltransferase [Armatimonadota bacterium]